MLKITIPAGQGWNSVKEEFVTNEKDTTITLEHSLVSVSKWESKWHKPFLSSDKKTQEELIDYIRCMTLTQNINDDVYYFLSPENYKEVNDYIENSMTATTFNDNRINTAIPRKKEVLTSEVIYYWMVSYQIPIECQKWHLNRLITLIRVCNIKNDSGKKMSKRDSAMSNKALNDARRKKFNTRG